MARPDEDPATTHMHSSYGGVVAGAAHDQGSRYHDGIAVEVDAAVQGQKSRRTGVAAAALTMSVLALVVMGVMTGSTSAGVATSEGELVSETTTPPVTGVDRLDVEAAREAEYSSFDNYHVMMILIDDMGHDDFGLTSSDMPYGTKTLNSLAKKGVLLQNYYTQSSCTPARVAFLTGRYPSNVGMAYDDMGAFTTTTPYGIPLKYDTIGNYFKKAGYRTAMIGKWNVGHFEENYLPHRRGFDNCLMYNSDAIHYYNYSAVPSLFAQLSPIDMLTGSGDSPFQLDEDDAGTYTTELFASRAVAELDLANDDDADPLFLYLAFQAVHTPHNPPPSTLYDDDNDSWKLKNVDDTAFRFHFGRTLIAMDKAVKTIWDHAIHMGISESTVLVVASDNGACPEDGGSNWPHRGGKFGSFEGGVRVPSFVYSESLSQSVAGTSTEAMVHVSDWLPTLLSLTGHSDVLPDDMDGIDQKNAVFHGYDETKREKVLLRLNRWTQGVNMALDDLAFDDAVGAIRYKQFKLIVNEHRPKIYQHGNSHNCSCAWEGETGTYLYDLENDPLEERNLYIHRPDIVANMTLMFREYYDSAPKSEYQPDEDLVCIEYWSTSYGGKGYVVPWHKAGEKVEADASAKLSDDV